MPEADRKVISDIEAPAEVSVETAQQIGTSASRYLHLLRPEPPLSIGPTMDTSIPYVSGDEAPSEPQEDIYIA